jgi:hypothetical protein
MRSASARAAMAAFAPAIAVPDPIPMTMRPIANGRKASLTAERANPSAVTIAPATASRRWETRGTTGTMANEVSASIESSIVPRTPTSCSLKLVPSRSACTVTGAALEPR